MTGALCRHVCRGAYRESLGVWVSKDTWPTQGLTSLISVKSDFVVYPQDLDAFLHSEMCHACSMYTLVPLSESWAIPDYFYKLLNQIRVWSGLSLCVERLHRRRFYIFYQTIEKY